MACKIRCIRKSHEWGNIMSTGSGSAKTFCCLREREKQQTNEWQDRMPAIQKRLKSRLRVKIKKTVNKKGKELSVMYINANTPSPEARTRKSLNASDAEPVVTARAVLGNLNYPTPAGIVWVVRACVNNPTRQGRKPGCCRCSPVYPG